MYPYIYLKHTNIHAYDDDKTDEVKTHTISSARSIDVSVQANKNMTQVWRRTTADSGGDAAVFQQYGCRVEPYVAFAVIY